MGIPTVATVAWTSTQIVRALLPMGAQTEFIDPTNSLCLAEVHIGEPWLGRKAGDLAQATSGRVAFLTRYGQALLPEEWTVIQEGDLVHLLFDPDRRDHVERICEKGQ